MSTARSWTEGRAELRRSRQDLAAILAFRRSGLEPKARRALAWGSVLVVAITLGAAIVPAYAAGPFPRKHAGALLGLFPSMCLGFLALSVVSAIASAGGREVIPREQAVALPVSTTTDHLGALLLAPLNIAWMLQAWTLLGVLSYALGTPGLLAYQLVVVLWVLTATALAQVVGWLSEGVRRGRRGTLVHRVLVGALLGTLGLLLLTGNMSYALDRSPTGLLLDPVLAGTSGRYGVWGLEVAVLAVLGVLAMLGGALPARWALHRPMREELRLEGGRFPARPTLRSDLLMMVRLDRAAIWRSVPLRRGMTVLALMPGGVALAGGLDWQLLTVLPGLVAAGGALLFGVNTWCLDARGALWRDSLPVSPGVGFASRVLVLAEILIVSAAVTLTLSALRAGRPTVAELAALVCATLVVTVQVVAACMRWSIARPFAVDLRSARATPAPPVVMVGYSARLALATTFSGLWFSAVSNSRLFTTSGAVQLVVCSTAVMVLWSTWRLWRAGRQWSDPAVRSRVIATVAG